MLPDEFLIFIVPTYHLSFFLFELHYWTQFLGDELTVFSFFM
jgi:hypothetical protein